MKNFYEKIKTDLQNLTSAYRKRSLPMRLRFFLYITSVVLSMAILLFLLLLSTGLIQPEKDTYYWNLLPVGIAFFCITILISYLLSYEYVGPIQKALNNLANTNPEEMENNSISEINEFMTYLSQQDQQHRQELQEYQKKQEQLEEQHNFYHENYLKVQKAFNAAQAAYEKTQSKYELVQEKLIWMQGKLNKLGEQKLNEIGWNSYKLFLSNIKTLTAKETEIYNMYTTGMNSKEIQQAMDIKENTLKYHNRNIYSKLGINSRKQLLLYATLMQDDKLKAANESN